jgi:type I restriction enzyme S subunit
MTDWDRTTIGDLISRWGGGIKTGPFGTALKASEYTKTGVPLISVGEIGYGNFRVGEHTPRVDLAVTNRLPEYLLETGDIVFGRKGGVDRSALVTENEAGWFLGSDGIRLRLPVNVNRRFVHYALSSRTIREWLLQQSTGSTMASLNQSIIARLPLSLPSRKVQDAVSNALGLLDDKIELNRRTNETLETMARAVFYDWLVDFGPIRRKQVGNVAPIEIMGALTLDPAQAVKLAASFPRALGGDGIPDGWRVRPLDKIAEFLNGLALQKYPAVDGEPSLPVIKIADLRGGISEKSARAVRSLPERYVVRNGDFIFSWSGSLMAKVWTEGDGALNQHLFKVTSAEYPQWFYAGWVQHHMAEFQNIAASKATTMGHIQRGHLSSAMAVCPTAATIVSMGEVLGPLWARRIHNSLEIQTLAKTRNYLLPRLMSGSVRVGNVAPEIAA